jgi:hypothetical protein
MAARAKDGTRFGELADLAAMETELADLAGKPSHGPGCASRIGGAVLLPPEPVGKKLQFST